MRTLFSTCLFFFGSLSLSLALLAQSDNNDATFEGYPSIKQEEALFYEQFNDLDSVNLANYGRPELNIAKGARNRNCELKKQVYGYHPFWMDKYYKGYDYSLLSTFCYFGYDLNPKTGNHRGNSSWKKHPSIDLAKKSGCKVELCVKNFSKHKTFLHNEKAWKKLADNLISFIDKRRIDGINIDFENIPRGMRSPFNKFMKYLSNRLKNHKEGLSLTLALPAIDWYKTFDFPTLNKYVDSYIIMGYDYHWSRSKNAGPVAPIYGKVSLNQSITNFVKAGSTAQKLILALPYYGREWRTKSAKVPSQTIKHKKAPAYSLIRSKYSKKYDKSRYKDKQGNPYYIIKRGSRVRQLWYDDRYTLAKKFDLAFERDLGGVGMWALGYDNGYNTLWNLIAKKFINCDNKKDKVIATTTYPTPSVKPKPASPPPPPPPPPAPKPKPKKAVPLPACKPYTTITPLNKVYNSDFTVSFNDSDGCEVGWNGHFYQVLTYSGTEWRANTEKGFFNDDFEGFYTHPDWQIKNGTWYLQDNRLVQFDENDHNTNIYTALKQDNQHAYMYHWWGQMGGKSTEKRSGLHFFSDAPTKENRGNSYFVYFRIDNSRAEIYKVLGDRFQRVAYQDYPLYAGTDYDFKVSYNPSSGMIEVYIDNKFVVEWRDSQPLQTGQYLSFRTGACVASFDFLKVYKSRGNSTTISVGSATNNDVRAKSPDAYNPSCRVISIAKNKYNQWTNVATGETRIE